MSNPLYQEMVQKAVQNSPIQMISQILSNPIQYAMSRGFNVPYNVGNDPNVIIQYLMNSGQVSQKQYNDVIQTAQNNYSQLSQVAQFIQGYQVKR